MMYASESRDPTIGSHQSYLLLADFVMGEDAEAARRQLRRGLAEDVGHPGWVRAHLRGQGARGHLDPTPAHADRLAAPVRFRLSPGGAPDGRPRGVAARGDDASATWTWIVRLLAAVTGESCTREELTRVAERAFTLERLLLARAGRARALEEALAPISSCPVAPTAPPSMRRGFSRLLDEYYAARGGTRDLGWPGTDQLRALGLGEAVPELERLREAQAARAQGR